MTTEEEDPVRERSPRSKPSFRNYKCFAMGIAYCGEGYFGSQIQPGDLPTVERDLQKALVDAGLVDSRLLTEDSLKSQFFWSRAARTDRGVHACMNLVACRLDSSKIKSSNSEPATPTSPLVLDQADFVANLNKHLPDAIRAVFINRVTMRFDARLNCERRRYEYYLPRAIGPLSIDWEALNGEMQKFVGTHKFHNFTKSVKYSTKQAVRHIVAIDVTPFGEDFICISLLGQSFLLNQIRKMIGLAVEVVLGLAPPDSVSAALTSPNVVHVHMVPGEGLLLDRLFFTGYDLHRCGDYAVTTPFSWILGEENDMSDMDSFVQKQLTQFKTGLLPEFVLGKLEGAFQFWMDKVVLANPWDKRHEAASTCTQSAAPELSNSDAEE